MQKYSFSLKTVLTLILIVSSFSFVFAQSQTYLDVNGFCAGFPVEFKVYNQSEWENREEIENDRDLEFTNISSSVIIYNGPFESTGELDSFETSDSGEFSFIFPEGGNFLVVVEPDNENYLELEEVVLMDPCEKANKNKEPIEFNTSFLYEQFSTELIFTQINTNSSSDIILSQVDLNSYPQLNNSISTFQISTINDSINFTSMNIETTLDYETGDIITLYSFEDNSWQPVEFTLNENKVIIEDAQLTTYAVTLELPQSSQQEETGSEQEETITEIITQEEVASQNSFLSSKSVLIGMGIIILLIFIFYMFVSNKKGKVSDEEKEFFSKNTNIETVHSYSQTYDKAKTYVKQYKQGYEKEQIRKALIAAQVPKDIIEKIFSEEY